jgi:hypothetical protein
MAALAMSCGTPKRPRPASPAGERLCARRKLQSKLGIAIDKIVNQHTGEVEDQFVDVNLNQDNPRPCRPLSRGPAH